MLPGDDAVVDIGALDRLIAVLGRRGYRTVGPVVSDGAIVYRELHGGSDLPAGWHDVQAPGRYRLEQAGDAELFGWAVGPASLKSEFFEPEETVFRASFREGAVSLRVPPPSARPVAVVGARPCELAGLEVLDRVLAGGETPDDRYTARRSGSLVVAVECGKPSSTCFCSSMGTGPDAGPGYDLALTELLGEEHRFYVQVGTEAGAALLEEVGWTEAGQRGPRRPGGRGGGSARRHGAFAADGGTGGPARPQSRASPVGGGGAALPVLRELHHGLPDLLLL